MESRRYAFALGPLGAASLWGGMYVVSKWGFGQIPPLTLGFLRVALGTGALYAVLAAKGVAVAREDYGRFVALGGWVTVTIATQFLGTELTTASQGALLTVLTPVFTLALGVLLLDEALTRVKVVGTALAAVGTLGVVAGRYSAASLIGDAGVGAVLLILASFAWAAYTVQGAPLVRRYSALTAATYSTVAATPILAALSAYELVARGIDPAGLPTSPPTLAAVAYLGLASTATAWYLWYKGLEYVDAGIVAAFFFAQPVVGATLGAALLGETVGPAFLVGGTVMAIGVYLVSRARD